MMMMGRKFTNTTRLLPWIRQCFIAKSEGIRAREKYCDQYLGRTSLFNFPAFRSEGDKLSTLSSMQKQQYVCFSNLVSYRKDDESKNKLQVETISTSYIKPAAPTPKHLRTYELSILDQVSPPVFSPFVYFYSNHHQNDSKVTSLDDLTLRRRQLLKRSLSETLTRFYPLAGQLKDYRSIDCNDEGVYCVEAMVSHTSLSDFLSQPGKKSVSTLLPFGYNPMALLSKANLIMIQLTTFSCGGIAIGIYASHKIIDGYSYATFLKAWATTATCATPENNICPSFIAPSIFPSAPTIPESVSGMLIAIFVRPGKSTTKRFVFSASSLTELRKRGGASRVLAVKGLIWKCVIKGLKARSTANDCCEKISALITAVNLRGRSSPPMPLYLMGNIGWNSRVTHQDSEDPDIGLNSLVQRLKISIDKLNGDFVEAVKGDNGSLKVQEILNEAKMFFSDENTKHIYATSLCNSGMYEVDFGWGKPIWVSCVNVGDANANVPVLTNYVLLMDTRSGNGIEAWVTLSNEDMAILEKDPELLQMASVDPSPLD